jgi:tetratricopeptide (TPR) repeat protein
MHGRCLLLALILTAAAAAQTPLRPAVPSSDANRELIRRGILLHDKGDYDGAIALYLQALDASPDDARALYEISFSYSSKHDYARCIEVAQRGLGLDSTLRGQFYDNLGNCQDGSGHPDAAIAAYEAGMKIAPQDAMLPLNVGVTLMGQKKPDQAKSYLQRSISLDSRHASTHWRMGIVYEQTQYKVPAILAYSVFLAMEPATQRSAQVAAGLRTLLGSGVKAGADPNHVTVQMDAHPRTEEGDFSAIALAMSLTSASGIVPPQGGPPKSDLDNLNTAYGIMTEILDRPPDKKAASPPTGFATLFYIPFFQEMRRLGYVPAFVRYVFQSMVSAMPEAQRPPLPPKYYECVAWIQNYSWPKVPVSIN